MNITIAPDAAFGARTVSVTADTATGSEVVQTAFVVVEATPTLAIVDPSAGMQGATLTVNVLAQHTAFDETTTFDFGAGVTVEEVVALGPTVAQVRIAIDLLAPQGFRFVTAVTGGSVVGGAGFVVTPSQAAIVSVAPNTARQQETLSVDVVGVNTHWNGAHHVLAERRNRRGGEHGDRQHPRVSRCSRGAAGVARRAEHHRDDRRGSRVARQRVRGAAGHAADPVVDSGCRRSSRRTVTLTVLGQSTGWAAGGTSSISASV